MADRRQPHGRHTKEDRQYRFSEIKTAPSVIVEHSLRAPRRSSSCHAPLHPHQNRMARLFLDREPLTEYKDRLFKGTMSDYLEALQTSSTLYVGNVSFFTSEEQIWDLFTRAGPVKAVVMGLDKEKKTPCGFCFVEYHNRGDAEKAVKYLNGTKLDEREVRMDFDWGFQEGRQFGRGKAGGQIRDDYRIDFDVGRGGYGYLLKIEIDAIKHSGGGEDEDEGHAEGSRGERRGGGDAGDGAAAEAADPDDGRVPMVVGSKRGRDEDESGDDDAQQPRENARFRGDQSEPED